MLLRTLRFTPVAARWWELLRSQPPAVHGPPPAPPLMVARQLLVGPAAAGTPDGLERGEMLAQMSALYATGPGQHPGAFVRDCTDPWNNSAVGAGPARP